MRITKVFTKTGDDGTTSLASGERLSKDHPRIVVLGSLDETNSAIGISLSEGVASEIKVVLQKIQNSLFDIGGELATPDKELGLISVDDVTFIESAIDNLNESLPPLEEFILPGGSKATALLHNARAVCRRAERDLVTLSKSEKVPELHMKFINRLSDYLFVAARFQNLEGNGGEEQWRR
jgi:cob(I)alamin adenosyltransferase